ncbi:MAG: hypothetical protein AB7Y74_02760 [Syntrophorhabdus sp.]|jgi:hypothetical protein
MTEHHGGTDLKGHDPEKEMMNFHYSVYLFMVYPFVEVTVQLRDRINATVIVRNCIDNVRG